MPDMSGLQIFSNNIFKHLVVLHLNMGKNVHVNDRV